MACFVLVNRRDERDVGRPFGPFVTRAQAEDWTSGVAITHPDGTAEFLAENHTVSFVDVDDFIAFGAEVN
jgi:hypothetical protein